MEPTKENPMAEQELQAGQLAAELSAHAATAEPVIEGTVTSQPAKEEMTSKGMAALAVMGMTKVAVGLYPCLENNFPEPVQYEAVEKLAPLLDKYNVKSEFFEKWRLEFEAGVFFAGVIFTSWQTIEADKAAKAAATDKEAANVS